MAARSHEDRPLRMVVLDGATLNPGDNPWDELAALGALTVHDRTAETEVLARARDAEVVLTNKTALSASTLEALPALRFVAVLATGCDVVDLEAARARQIGVANVPAYATDAVAQHTFALLLELTNAVAEHDAAVGEGAWTRSPDFSFWKRPPRELAGLAFGVVGYGATGRSVARIAAAMRMRVLVATPHPPADAEPSVRFCGIDELFAEADVVSLHCPLTDATRDLVNEPRLQTMRPGALLINTARGALVDEQAVASALHRGTLGGFATDVLAAEPAQSDNPILGAPRALVTAHMAWASLAARRRLMSTTVDNVRAYRDGVRLHRVA